MLRKISLLSLTSHNKIEEEAVDRMQQKMVNIGKETMSKQNTLNKDLSKA